MTEWESGVGGAQCDDCGRTTIVRAGATDMLGVPTFWTCRPCAYGGWEDDEATDLANQHITTGEAIHAT